MTSAFCTAEACNVFEILKREAQPGLIAINEKRFAEARQALSSLRNIVADTKGSVIGAHVDYLNDIFVLERIVEFLLKYVELWEEIINQRFCDSWVSLQDALDLLRLVKRFSHLNIEFFENQLTELEKTYPYSVFFSVGIAVECFNCSICGLDIDLSTCPHRRGQLYAGVMAKAIAHKISYVDHVAMVTNPEDKRCVVKYDDSGEQFKVIRLLSTLVRSNEFRISDFDHLEFSKRKRANPNYVKLGRNDQCYCGSGKKFKKCCISQHQIEGDHVDLIASARRIEDALA